MKFRKITAIYSIVVGLGMAAVWLMLLISGRDAQLQNELQTIPFSITLAIISDLVTAAALLVAGVAVLRRAGWAYKPFLLGMGALFYSVINAIGLYGQRGDVAFLAMFDIILVFGLVLTVLTLRHLASQPEAIKVIAK
jgi:hypothetical protein